MKQTKILIVEDEVLIAEDLKDIIKGFGYIHIELAHSKSEAIEMLNKSRFDIILLDIRMENEISGLELGTYINEHFQTPFIFITAHSDIAMIKKIIKTKPAAYITKPIKKSDLFATLNLIQSQFSESSNSQLVLKDGYTNIKLPLQDILHIEGEGNYINIYTTLKKIVSRQSLDSISEQLPQEIFFRIHRSHIVNTHKVSKFSRKEVEIGGKKLPISRNVAKQFENFMNL